MEADKLERKSDPWIAGYRYIALFVLTVALICAAALVAVIAFEDVLPAPRLSSSESFNEKARWLRKQRGGKGDVLVIGSSMALNNIDGVAIKKDINDRGVINTGSWGLSIAESAELATLLVPIFKPNLILLAAYYGDFDKADQKSIDWPLFKSYIEGATVASVYLKSMDIKYYATTFFARRKMVEKGNSIYQSLNFDSTGAVILDCDKFEVEIPRWNGYLKKPLANEGAVRKSMEGLLRIGQIAKQNNSRLLVISTPMRRSATERLAAQGVDRLWREAAGVVLDSGGTFIDFATPLKLDDALFADFAHLNRCGTAKLAEVVSPAMISALQNSP